VQSNLASTLSRRAVLPARLVLVTAAVALAFLIGVAAGYVARSLTAAPGAHATAATQASLSSEPAWGYSVRRHGTQSVEGSSLPTGREPAAGGRGGPQLVA
jgi:hypothetical protein